MQHNTTTTPQHDRSHEFIRRLADLTIDDLDRVAGAIEVSMTSSADWLEWRRACAAADRAVRRLGRAREAGVAAHAAAEAVVGALQRQLPLPDARVTMVARAAREVAAALVAEDGDPEATAALLAPWAPIVPRTVAAA